MQALAEHHDVLLGKILLNDALELLDKNGAADGSFIPVELLGKVFHD